MRDMISAKTKMVAIAFVIAIFLSGLAMAQGGKKAAAQGDVEAPVSSIILSKMDWVISDISRCIEELRHAEDQWQKRYLVEQIEDIFLNEIEYPMIYQQTKDERSLNVIFTGTTSDVASGSEANPLAPKYAEAIALVGIAKGYEGFSAAATDYIMRAQSVYSDVMSIKIKIDSFEDYKTLSQWMADARGRWGGTNPVRVTFYGKSVMQDVVDKLNMENVEFETDQNISDYYLYAAERDFLRGMRMRIATDDVLKKDRINEFNIYLPPGTYRLITDVASGLGIVIEVDRDPRKNQYVIETIQDGITVYPMAGMRQTGKSLKPVEGKTPPTEETQPQPEVEDELTGGEDGTE